MTTRRIGNSEFNAGSHCIFRLTYHVVWCVKFRRRFLSHEKIMFLRKILHEESAAARFVGFNDWQIEEFDGEEAYS